MSGKEFKEQCLRCRHSYREKRLLNLPPNQGVEDQQALVYSHPRKVITQCLCCTKRSNDIIRIDDRAVALRCEDFEEQSEDTRFTNF